MTTDDFPANSELASIVVKILQTEAVEVSNEKLRDLVIRRLSLPQRLIDEIHSGKRTELEYRLAWARTIAKQRGLIESTSRCKWKFMP